MDYLNGVCWEGVIILRRLILVVIAELMSRAIHRQVFLTLVCLLALMVHVRIQPFKRSSSNALETGSLAILLCIAIMNLIKAVFIELGEIPRDSVDTLLQIYDIIEQFIVSFIPLLFLAFLIICVLVRVCLIPCSLMSKNKEAEAPESSIENGKHSNDLSSSQSLQSAKYQSLEGYPPATGSQLPYQ